MKPLIQLRSVCLVVALLLGGLSTQAASRPRYEIVDLGTIPGGGYPAQGTDINNSGQITAIARGSNLFYRACIYENGALRDLGIGTNGSGAQINDAGAMIGSFGTDWDTFTHGRDHAFMITTGGIFTDLSVQFNRYVSPGGINNFGHIVGNAETDDGTSIVPFIYSNGVFQLIPVHVMPYRAERFKDSHIGFVNGMMLALVRRILQKIPFVQSCNIFIQSRISKAGL